MPQTLGVVPGPVVSRAKHWGVVAGIVEQQLPRESLHLVRLSLRLELKPAQTGLRLKGL